MKKVAIFLTALTFTIIIFSCGAKDDKNKVEHYPSTDTTQHIENKNDGMHDSINSRSH